ncbi:MAG: PAS domain-containing protein [Phycisphaera sp.]|nr:PAS domain-containing protein [Phycisphaera sp.]
MRGEGMSSEPTPKAKLADATWEPKVLWAITIVLTILPALLPALLVSDAAASPMDAFRELTGSLTHTVIGTAIICAAVFTGLLALEQVRMGVRAAAPVIGVTLCWAACVDIFNNMYRESVLADIAGSADREHVTLYIWMVSRVFIAIILMLGPLVMLRRPDGRPTRRDQLLIFLISPILFVVAHLLVRAGTNPDHLVHMHYPSAFLRRPWELLPAALFLLGAVWVYPRQYKRDRTLFSLGMGLSMLPEIAAHLFIGFGLLVPMWMSANAGRQFPEETLASTPFFEANFYIAHLLALVAYAIRMGGLMLDHSLTYVEVREVNDELARTNDQLRDEIAERVRAQEAEREVEAVYSQLVESMPMAVFRKDTEGRFDFVNKRMCDMLKHSREELIGKTYYDVFEKELADEYTAVDERVMRTREVVDEVESYRGVNRGKGFVHYLITPVINHRDEVIGVRGMFEDVTDLMDAREKAEKAEQQFDAEARQRQRSAVAVTEIASLYTSLLESLPIAVFRKDIEGGFTFVNDQFCEMVGKGRVDILGARDEDLFPADVAGRYAADDKRVMQTGEVLDQVESVPAADGSASRIRVYKTPVKDSDGNIIGVHGIFFTESEVRADVASAGSAETADD